MNTFTWIVWGLLTTIGLVTTAWAIRKAFRDPPEKVIWWRRAKVVSACLGLAGVALSIIALERTVREFNDASVRYLYQDFLDLKFYTTGLRAIACSKDLSNREAANECFDFRNLDNQVSFTILDSGKELIPPTNWQRNPHLDAVISEITSRFEDMNRVIALAGEKPILPYEFRVKMGVLGLIFVIIALSLSIGESLYQLRQAQITRSAAPEVTSQKPITEKVAVTVTTLEPPAASAASPKSDASPKTGSPESDG